VSGTQVVLSLGAMRLGQASAEQEPMPSQRSQLSAVASAQSGSGKPQPQSHAPSLYRRAAQLQLRGGVLQTALFAVLMVPGHA
jgi:hypothetical protein